MIPLDLGRYHFDCRLFNGYKPCFPGWVCVDCKEYAPMEKRLLLIQLGSLGDVLRTTTLLPAIQRKYPNNFLTWLAYENAFPLLAGNPYIHRLLPMTTESILFLQAQEFDGVMNLEKTASAPSLVMSLKAKEKVGFGLWKTGVVAPLNPAAEELFRLGVDDHFRFFENQKTMQLLFAEALTLDYRGEEYILELTGEEKKFVQTYRKENGVKDVDFLIGINTGCSDRIPYRRFTYDKLVELVEELLSNFREAKIALLGGREDTETHSRLKAHFGSKILYTPTTQGLRKGICFVGGCDLVITGDSVGMHIAIALKKPVVAWFAPTPSQEIDLYGRGTKLLSQVTCKPCLKHFCDFAVKCNEIVEIGEILDAVRSILEKLSVS